jgi:hypothetical protein
MIREILLDLLLVCMFFPPVYAQDVEEVIFLGTPIVKISESGINRVAEDLKGHKAEEAKCVIVKVGDKYLWKTRNNVEM